MKHLFHNAGVRFNALRAFQDSEYYLSATGRTERPMVLSVFASYVGVALVIEKFSICA